MITERAIRADIDLWFHDPTNLVPTGDTFEGVLVFERCTPVKKGPMRLGVAVGPYHKQRWVREGAGMTMPFTSQPSEAWSGARCVGLATTKEEALALLFPKP